MVYAMKPGDPVIGMKEGPWQDYEVQVIVPHGRSVWMVAVDGGDDLTPATRMNTVGFPGGAYGTVETWSARLREPPHRVVTYFNPQPR